MLEYLATPISSWSRPTTTPNTPLPTSINTSKWALVLFFFFFLFRVNYINSPNFDTQHQMEVKESSSRPRGQSVVAKYQ